MEHQPDLRRSKPMVILKVVTFPVVSKAFLSARWSLHSFKDGDSKGLQKRGLRFRDRHRSPLQEHRASVPQVWPKSVERPGNPLFGVLSG
jgi:hypothetical protein